MIDTALQGYASYALQEPTKCKVVAIAEPRPLTQKTVAAAHAVDKTLVFESWQDLLKASADTIQTIGKRLADAVVIAVQDQMHLEVTLAFAAQGYHILCEKPMATSLEDCVKIEAAVKKAGIIFGMGHGASLPRADGPLEALMCLGCSPQVLPVQQSCNRDRPLRGAWPPHQRCAHRAGWLLPLRALLRPRELGAREGQQLLADDQELPVRRSPPPPCTRCARADIAAQTATSTSSATGSRPGARPGSRPSARSSTSARTRSRPRRATRRAASIARTSATARTARRKVCAQPGPTSNVRHIHLSGRRLR